MTTTDAQLSATCQICLHALGADEVLHQCPSCKSLYHAECWQELGGCAVYGCPKMVEIKKAEDMEETHWGATEKKCPICVETIPIAATVCPFCNTVFKDKRPLSREELLPEREDPALHEYRRGATWLFIISLLGCTSPFVLIFGGLWYREHREDIMRAGAQARALSLIGLGICVLYIVVFGISLLVWTVTT
jgi:hypothetical protein